MTPLSVERLHPGTLRTSVSELETFAACPFQHFARYGLSLRERPEAVLEAVDVGQVHHAILEDLVRDLATQDRAWEPADEVELMSRLGASCVRVAARLPADGTLSDARNAYLLRRSASDLARIIRAQQRRSRPGTVRPRAAEIAFGFGQPGSLEGLELVTPAGRRILLRGYIDRVDLVELNDELLGIVVDYKRTRNKSLDLSGVYHGLSLQLLAYLLVLEESGRTLAGRPIRPIGAFYVGLIPRYLSVDHPEHAKARDLATGGTDRPRGLLLGEQMQALDGRASEGWSDHYSLYRKRDGTPGYVDASDGADAASFRAALDYTRTKLGLLADAMLDGEVSASPYRLKSLSPCGWCAMQSVCRFEMPSPDVRYLESWKRSEVFRRMTIPGA